MAISTPEKTYVRLSSDEMEAYLYLSVPEDGHVYTRMELMDILLQNRVTFGIDESKIDDIATRGIHYREMLVAEGKKPKDGIDGLYEYKFNLNPSQKPAIREDGTVDYWSVFAVQTVAAGDVIAIYKPATAGVQGQTVTGKVIEGKRGKELLPLKGKGFECTEDNVTYVATIDGKIEFQNDRINITNMLEIKGDLDFNNGRIDFRGDVVIHGEVQSGSIIHSGGSVTIDGSVEHITIMCAKDVILRKGLQGGGKAVIKSGGSIFAQFIEGAHVEAKGCIQADVLMNSEVSAGESILITGKKATIVGGTAKAISSIEVTNAGNMAEVKTKLCVGMDDEAKERMKRIKSVFGLIDDMLNEIHAELAELEKKKGEDAPKFVKERDKERTMELLRKKIKCISDKAEFSKELEDLEDKSVKSKGAFIAVSKYTFPGVSIQVNTATIPIKQRQLSMQYRYEGGEVVLYDLFPNAQSK
jgi:uncharacterized protein (DUF342 family)